MCDANNRRDVLREEEKKRLEAFVIGTGGRNFAQPHQKRKKSIKTNEKYLNENGISKRKHE